MPETPREWAARLSADDCVTLITAALEAGDMRAVDAAMRLLATKDARRADLVLKTMEVGLALRGGA